MIGKSILAFITKRRQSVADWLKGDDAQLPTGQIKGVVVELDWQVACTAETLSETMAQIKSAEEQLHKNSKVLHVRMETRMLIGEHGANVPQALKYDKWGPLERGKRYHYVCKECGHTKPCSFDRALKDQLVECICGQAMEMEVKHRYYCEKCGETKADYVPVCSKCGKDLQLALQEDG